MDSCPIEIPDSKDQRFSVLSYEQVSRLSDLMNEVVPIHGRGNFPTLEVKLCDLVSLVKDKLEQDGVSVKEIRLNGSGASSVLASEYCDISYNDLDLIFTVDLPTQKHYERVKQAVLDSLLDLLPEQTSKKRMSSCTLKEAYVSKMVKVNDSDRWSLIALGNNKTNSVELKFVDKMKRKFEFSVDSFHIMLDTLFLFYDCARMDISENFYPTVVGESVYGNFTEALFHLHRKLIATRSPEEIRGGGLLKYCNLLVKNYRPARPEEVKTMERYMCSRFFIDFPDLTQQHNKLFKFLDNHFHGADSQLKYDYLMILYQVVDESTVCLMGHERRQTLALIQDLSCQVGNYYDIIPDNIPVTGTNTNNGRNSSATNWSSSSSSSGSSLSSSSSSASSSSSSSSWSSSSSNSSQSPPWANNSKNSGQFSPMSTSSSCSPSLSPKPADCVPDHPPPVVPQVPTPVPHKYSVPPPTLAPPPPLPSQMSAPPPPLAVQCPPPQQTPCITGTNIPTYEIVTSCQPSVMYSNGYYYTSFLPPPSQSSATSFPSTTVSTTPSLQYTTVSGGSSIQYTNGGTTQPQYSTVVASGATQYNNVTVSGAPQYSSGPVVTPQYSTVACSGVTPQYNAAPQYNTVQVGGPVQTCYSCSCSCGAPGTQGQWVATVAPQPSS